MRTTTLGMTVMLLAGCAADGSDMQETATAAPAAAISMAHTHMGHVLDSWQDTPDQRGFLPTAQAEAEIAAQHAALANQRPDDLDWMKMHVVHVVNAIDPSVEPAGPGLGYGVRPAAEGMAKHIGLAAASDDASDNVKLHAEHVATSSENVVDWSAQIVELADEVDAAESATEAAPLVAKIETVAQAIQNGRDDNADGQVTWERNEGGLAQAAQHMQFMKTGEGLS
jgi:hypothetical protein